MNYPRWPADLPTPPDLPKYGRHATGVARVKVNGEDCYPPGPYDSLESKTVYANMIFAALNTGNVPTPDEIDEGVSLTTRTQAPRKKRRRGWIWGWFAALIAVLFIGGSFVSLVSQNIELRKSLARIEAERDNPFRVQLAALNARQRSTHSEFKNKYHEMCSLFLGQLRPELQRRIRRFDDGTEDTGGIASL